MRKEAQFYIIAAVVIAVVIAGLIKVINYAIVRPTPVQFYDLSKQLEQESTRVIDYGTFMNKDVTTYVDDFVIHFLRYAKDKDPNIGIIYIYGNTSQLIIANYGSYDAGVFTKINRTILYGADAETINQLRIDIGGAQVGKKIIEEKSIFGNFKTAFAPAKNIWVNISGRVYSFDLKGEQYFFAIVGSEKAGEIYYNIVK